MEREIELTVIVPTYNERDNIPVLLERIDKALSSHGIKYEVIIVDDNSPDGTADVAEKLSSKYPVRVLRRPGKLGLSSAVLDGIKLAKSKVIAVMDADLQHPPEVLPKLYTRIKDGCEIVIASRYVKGGSTKDWSLLRKLISKIAIVIAHILIPKSRAVKDIMSGYFMLRKDVISNTTLNPRGFKILLEIIAKAKYSNVCEVPYTFDTRKYGKSKLGGKEIINYVLHALSLSPYIVRFALVGGIGTVVNLLSLAILRYVLGLIHEISSAIAIELSIINNFILNDRWTFKDRRSGSTLFRLFKFHLSSIAGVLTQYLTSISLYHLVLHESLSSQFVGILIGFIVNYLISRYYVWR